MAANRLPVSYNYASTYEKESRECCRIFPVFFRVMLLLGAQFPVATFRSTNSRGNKDLNIFPFKHARDQCSNADLMKRSGKSFPQTSPVETKVAKDNSIATLSYHDHIRYQLLPNVKNPPQVTDQSHQASSSSVTSVRQDGWNCWSGTDGGKGQYIIHTFKH